jgi:hypothetical protein
MLQPPNSASTRVLSAAQQQLHGWGVPFQAPYCRNAWLQHCWSMQIEAAEWHCMPEQFACTTVCLRLQQQQQQHRQQQQAAPAAHPSLFLQVLLSTQQHATTDSSTTTAVTLQLACTRQAATNLLHPTHVCVHTPHSCHITPCRLEWVAFSGLPWRCVAWPMPVMLLRSWG